MTAVLVLSPQLRFVVKVHTNVAAVRIDTAGGITARNRVYGLVTIWAEGRIDVGVTELALRAIGRSQQHPQVVEISQITAADIDADFDPLDVHRLIGRYDKIDVRQTAGFGGGPV